ncbi:MAG: radical SAM protein [Deltaproteobacteria bacterium]|nr:radical SAM protein [Deltaproteobacteria bacterium]
MWQRTRAAPARLRALTRAVLADPPFHGYRGTRRRLANLYLNRLEHHFRRPHLRSLPLKLIIEPFNACNLRCPGCFTGAGGRGRPTSMMPMALYEALLRELGDVLFEVEAFNWGEPLLHPAIEDMVAAASARGIGTKLNTNFSVPFDAARAARLVRAGLTTLTVSIDGARQATYERYRVRGDLERVLHNCRLMVDAKARYGTMLPALNWEFHVFPHNVGDVDAVRAAAATLGMQLLLFKGAVPGGDWDVERRWQFCVDPQPLPCASLWAIAVVNNDGGVAPCNGTFYREDDMGRLALDAASLARDGFRAVWNNAQFTTARRFYRRRAGDAAARQHVCFDCPQTRLYEDWRRHLAGGGEHTSFVPAYTTSDGWNYFWNRRPPRSGGHATGGIVAPRPSRISVAGERGAHPAAESR